VQHWLAVYLPEFEIPTFFLDADLSATPPRRALLENILTSSIKVKVKKNTSPSGGNFLTFQPL
jgi:hypothetical protein